MPDQAAPLSVDDRGFIYADGVKICYLDRQRQTLQFHDKNKYRAHQRGTDQITVSLTDLANLVHPIPPAKIDTPPESATIELISPPVKGED